jgi:hypothetical protein
LSRYCGDFDSEPIIRAADHWRTQALKSDGSIFSQKALWRLENLKAVEQYYVNNIDQTERTFLEKLKEQLTPTTPETKQLVAEMLWVMLLSPSNLTPGKKREDVKLVWGWSGEALSENSQWLNDQTLKGIGSAGQSFSYNRWRELTFLVRFMLAFKVLDPSERDRLLNDGWAFAEWLKSVPEEGSRQLRHMILFLLFPDQFERSFAGTDRRQIVMSFTGKSHADADSLSPLEIDRELQQIRRAQEEKLGTKKLDFYVPPLSELWSRPGFEQFTKDITREHVLKALEEIDREGIPSDAHSTTYDLISGQRRYPPKLVLALASKHASGQEFDRSLFTGGEASPAFALLRKLSFHIERKDFVEALLSKFLKQAESADDLSTKSYPKSYRGLQVSVSFGKGNFGRIPWISFLGHDQKTTDGIYPVYLFYRDAGVLVLAYGISETKPPTTEWKDTEGAPTIREYLKSNFGKTPERYGDSFVFSAYRVPDEIDGAVLTTQLDRLIAKYSAQFGSDEGVKIVDPEPSDGGPRHWWLNANPKIWDFAETPVGGRQTYTSVNEQGNKRQRYKYFQDARPGDIIVGYVTSPDREIVAICKITKALGLHGGASREAIEFEKIEQLATPVPLQELQKNPALKQSEPLINNQGSLFRLTPEEYATIRTLIDELNPPIEPKPQPFSKKDALGVLFLAEDQLDEMLSALQEKRNVILQGAPGVGKTFVAKRLAYALIGLVDQIRVQMVQFHQSYSYEDFIQGFRPSESGQFELKNGHFFQFCRRAQRDPENRPYVYIIDEINRGNLSKIFGEVMMLIEPDKRGKDFAIPLTYSSPDESFFVPHNVYLIGMMNTADRSLAMVDYALRRRFRFITLKPEFSSARFPGVLAGTRGKPSLDPKNRRTDEPVERQDFCRPKESWAWIPNRPQLFLPIGQCQTRREVVCECHPLRD